MLHIVLHGLYSALFTCLVIPILFIRLCYKALNDPKHLNKIAERFGFYPFHEEHYPYNKTIWLHAVSLGESKAALPLIYYLLENYDNEIIITTMTLTGAQCILTEFAAHPRVTHFYAPYDSGFVVRRFLKHIKPRICLLMETEIWPTILYECHRHAIPIVILNARLSKKSIQGYQKYSLFFKPYIDKISMICAQSHQDLQNFLHLGVSDKKVANVGNLKFDLQLPEDLAAKAAVIKQHIADKFVLVVASTHHNEEEIILQAIDQLKIDNLLLIIVPRHPERFAIVENLLQQQQRKYIRKTAITPNHQFDVDIILGDTIGELLVYYSLADLCFVGGSMVAIGGHNLLEPAMLQKPIITGHYLDNFVELSQKLIAANGLLILKNHDNFVADLAQLITNLYTNAQLRLELASNAYHTVLENRGALARTCVILTSYI
jgi:3-deoxy-D-manno-octulosonic-acid transferase